MNTPASFACSSTACDRSGCARRAVHGGRPAVPDEVMLDSGSEFGWIERSWRRCLANGQRPGSARGFRRDPARRRRGGSKKPTTRCCRPRGRCSTSSAVPSPTRRYFAILTDAHGVVIDAARPDRPRRPPRPADHPHRRRPVGARSRHHRHRRRAGRTAAGVAAPRRALLRRHQRATAAPARRCSARTAMRRHAGPDGHRRRRAARAQAPGVPVGAQHRERAGAQPAALRCCCALNWPGRAAGRRRRRPGLPGRDGLGDRRNATARQMIPQLASARRRRRCIAANCSRCPGRCCSTAAGRERAPVEVPLWSGLTLAGPGAAAAARRMSTPWPRRGCR